MTKQDEVARAARLAAALRENLKKRKARTPEGQSGGEEQTPPPGP
ncbi:hypothetical protein [Sandarakinorhabdus sp.]|nr:hypothetical protein [Sandarakinorhabdus sp.]